MLTRTFMPGQNARHLACDIFKSITLYENHGILFHIVSNGPINNMPALV